MAPHQNYNIQEESEFKKLLELFSRNYKLFILCVIIAVSLAFLINRYSVSIYNISSSILIKEGQTQQNRADVSDYLNSNLLGRNQNLQNELWVIKSSPVIEQTIRDLDLEITYYNKGRFQYYDAYQSAPFQILYVRDHPQPLNVKIDISFNDENNFQLKAESKRVSFYNYETEKVTHSKAVWSFIKSGKVGEMIETPDLAFIVKRDSTKKLFHKEALIYGFDFKTVTSLRNAIKENLGFRIVDRLATVIEISLKSESLNEGIDFVNGLMNVYSERNLDQKNHIASITINYIEKQLNEISDSLNLTEDNLQRFRSSNQLLNITDQASEISSQYMDLQNQLAELVSQKRYYDYVLDLLNKGNFSNMMLPASMGIPDQLLNNLMSELLTAQAQRSNLIENNQERNPLVQKLGIQIENLKNTISENIATASKTTSVSMDEMNKRISKIEAQISKLPVTQRQLGNIERKYRLNDAIYNYLMEKHAEAKITKASNLPDNVIVEPAKMVGSGPVSPNIPRNYLVALFLGLALPFGFVLLKSALNNRIESQEDIEHLTDKPVLGKILHNRYKTKNVMFEFPKSNVAESLRALRTNLDFYVRGGQKKVILITSCLENEGKSFIALNLAISYAQLGRKTILVDCDFRKPKTYFKEGEELSEGLSSYMIDKADLKNLIIKSPHEKLDYILSGILPPNPAELLALEKTEELLNKLKNDYDIVVLDTTPLAQVTDAYLLIDHSDVKIIVTRYGQTKKNVLSFVIKDLNQKNVNNICIVLNDNKVYRDQYGYGYGYNNKKGFFKNKVEINKKRVEEFSSRLNSY